MTIKLSFNPKLTDTTRQLCKDYWAFENNGGYIKHVQVLCKQYDLTPHEVFRIIGMCFVYLDDVCCEYCGCYCPIEVPADIPYFRSKGFWFCNECVRFSGGQVLIGR